jgi:tRNA G18 (ribose-2'-O)-methylase SpoU
MRQQEDYRRQGIFVVEVEKVARRLLESLLVVVSVLLPEKWFREYQPILQARPEEILAYLAPKVQLEQMTGFSMYQGVLAVCDAAAAIPMHRGVDSLNVASAAAAFLYEANRRRGFM